jgi:hypothetical protein
MKKRKLQIYSDVKDIELNSIKKNGWTIGSRFTFYIANSNDIVSNMIVRRILTDLTEFEK